MQSLQKEQVTMPILPEREDLQRMTVDVARTIRQPHSIAGTFPGCTHGWRSRRGSDDPPAPLQGPFRGVPMDGAVGGGARKFYLGGHHGKTAG